MIPAGAWRRVFALRIAWYVAMIAAPTLALTVARDDRRALALVALGVATLALLTFPLSRPVRATALALTATAAALLVAALLRGSRAG